jgi:hypothetical protein
MRGGRIASGIRLAVLALFLGSTLGVQCGGGEAQTWVALIPRASTVGTFAPLEVDVVVSTPTPVQAFELGLQWDPQMLQAVNAAPHPGFDDDGALFVSPRFDLVAGTLERVADLRHGGPGAEGRFTIATLEFLSLGVAGSTTIELATGRLADADGGEPATLNLVPVTITIEP